MVTELPAISPTARFTARQAARVLGVHYNTVYNKMRSGEIRSFSRGDNLHAFIKGIDIIRYFNSEK
ncbi:MAG: helix-turn-helix domain-containing protein [Bacteroidales bacterium]|nr:helix-turn-helix domain-containing protein [Bacteroidales bacterium]